MAITSELKRLAAMAGTGSLADLYTCPASSRILSPVVYVNTIAVADSPILSKTNAAVGTAYVTAHQIAKRVMAVDDDQQIEVAGMEAGDLLRVNALATTTVELWGVIDA
jgi:hypothetical protein